METLIHTEEQMPIMYTPEEQAISDLRALKTMLYWLGVAHSSSMKKEDATGVYSNGLHRVMQTHKTLPQLIAEQECDNKQMHGKLGYVLRNLPDRLAWPGSKTMQWTLAKPEDFLEFGPVTIDGQEYLFIRSPALEKKVSVLHAVATKAGKAQWEDTYAAEKAATWKEYENTMSPGALRAHVLVERQDAPRCLDMECLHYISVMAFLHAKVAVRLDSGEFFVTRNAPATDEWRTFHSYTQGRSNMLATYGQLSADTQQALHASTVRKVMDDLLFRSQPPA
jgi:hypothetical protein